MVMLELLSREVQLSRQAHRRLCLILEEGVPEHLVVDVQLAHLGPRPSPRLLLGRVLPGETGVAHLSDARLRQELRQLPLRLFVPALPLQVLPLLGPVPRDRHGVPQRFQVDQQPRVVGCRVVRLDDIRSVHQLLQLRDGQAIQLLMRLAGHDLVLFLVQQSVDLVLGGLLRLRPDLRHLGLGLLRGRLISTQLLRRTEARKHLSKLLHDALIL
eukprot:scaffold1307_cov200-Pinguiococcus_pyrenoidosus.AAC.47